MSLNINQFGITTRQGQVDLTFPNNIITCQVGSSQVTALVAGQAVKLLDVAAGGVPNVVSLAANTNPSFGVVVSNIKDINYPAGARVEIGLAGTFIWLTAGAAIAAGAKLEFVYTTNKVITNAGTNPLFGYALDQATADGDLIRVGIINPQTSAITIADVAALQTTLDSKVQTAVVTASTAEINAGKTLVAGVTGKKIRVIGVVQRVVGNFAACTSVDVQSSNGTPVKVLVSAVAALTNGALLFPSSANVTPGAGFALDLGVNDGLVVANVGSAATTGTSIQYTVTYVQAA